MECSVSLGAKISPSRREPKNEVVAAHQMTCLVRGSHGALAIFDPMVINRGMVTTLRIFVEGKLKAIFETPFISREIVESLEM
jgi:hypothetical protein